jgi:hypothetical protein
MDDCLYLTLSVPDVGMQEQAEHSATYLMHAEHAKLAIMEKKKKSRWALYDRARHMPSDAYGEYDCILA